MRENPEFMYVNSAIFNGKRLWRRPRPKLSCGAKERERV
jgi:hypothetical protein